VIRSFHKCLESEIDRRFFERSYRRQKVDEHTESTVWRR
jgi:hypothetical protein